MPLPAIAFGKLASAIGVRGFIAIGLALALGIAVWRADSLSQSLTETKAALTLAEGEIALLKADAALKEIAAAERQNDNAAVAEAEKDLLDALNDVPDTQPDAVRIRLNCARLKRANVPLPSVCGSVGG